MAVLLSSCARNDAGVNLSETTESNETSSLITSDDNDTLNNKTTEYTIYFGLAEGDNMQLSSDNIKFETALSELEAVIAKLEDSNTPLDEALKLYEK